MALIAQDTLTKKEINRQKKNFLLPGKPWLVEVPLWIPGFRGNFAYGDISIEGEDGADIENPVEPPDKPGFGDIFSRIFSTRWYLKFFFLTKLAYEKNRFIAQLDGLTGAVGESTQFNYNNAQIVQANFRTVNLRLLAGYKIINTIGKKGTFQYELFGYLGVRAHFHKIYSDLDGLVNKLDISPSWFEPIIGLQNQFTWKRWFLVLQGDYGGFFVDQKYSFQFTGYAYYRSGKITSVKIGWNHLDLNHKGTFIKENFKVKATLSGPSAGIVFHF